MQFRKIAGPLRIDSPGASTLYPLPGRAGGRMCKGVQYMVKIIQSDSTECQIGMDVAHGPDGDVYLPLKADVIPFTSVGTAYPFALAGAVGQDQGSSPSSVVGEWIQPTIKIQDDNQASARWAMVEVWEMRKPF